MQLFAVRELELDDGDFLFNLRLHFHLATDDDEDAVGGLGEKERVLHCPQEHRVRLDEQVEVPEQDNGLFRDVPESGKGGKRVLRFGECLAFDDVDQAFSEGP